MSEETPTHVPTTPATGDTSIIVIRNIPRLLWEEDLKRYFSQFGDVVDVRIPRGRRVSAAVPDYSRLMATPASLSSCFGLLMSRAL